MLKKLMLTVILALIILPYCCSAEKSAVLVIIDGLGSTYIYPGRTPACVDDSPLERVHLGIVANASMRFELWVPTPDTESGNAVIATGYSGASEEAVTYYEATIYDVLRTEGYLCMGVMETGDTAEMIAEPDIVVYERNNSIYKPDVAIAVNSPSVLPGIENIFMRDPPVPQKAGSDYYAAYRQYDEWSLNKGINIIDYMGQAYPGQKYLLTVNIAGPDMAAHEHGYGAYRKAIEDIDEGLSLLADRCRATNTVMIVTSDHGMGFKTPDTKGSHASGLASMRNETRLAPLLIFNGEKGDMSGVYGQQCLAPTLLSLLECPNTLCIADGVPVPVNLRPSLYLISDEPVSVVIESPGFYRQFTVNGTCHIGPLDADSYRLTLPWGVRTISLDQDVTIRLADTVQGEQPAVSWVPYVAAAVVSAAGIALALGMMRRK